MYDLVISGLGSSGSQCTENLAIAGLKNTLLEKNIYQRKPCGRNINSKTMTI